jgi:hypothetical protein
LKLTLHFAETEFSASDTELSTLLSWKPDRLGHVIHVKAQFREIIEKENIGVELCLSCNVCAKMIVGSYDVHLLGVLAMMLTATRPTTSVYSAVRCLRNGNLLQNTLALTGLKSRRCVSGRWTPSSLVRMRKLDLGTFTRGGEVGLNNE